MKESARKPLEHPVPSIGGTDRRRGKETERIS